MKRQHGFTLLELITSLGLISAVTIVAGALMLDSQRAAALAESYEIDVRATRHVLDTVERDIRSARDVRTGAASLVASTDTGSVEWRLDAGALRRGGVVVARNIALFDASRRGDLVEVTIELGRRAPGATRTARVETTARLRAPKDAVAK